MKKASVLILFIITVYQVFAQNITFIKAKQIEKGSDLYEDNLAKYKTNESLHNWTMPIGDPHASSELAGQNSYSVKNLIDNDLNTAWIVGSSDYGIGEKFWFTFNLPEDEYVFFGGINLFNGYCKSLALWEGHSRVKKLKVYYNDHLFCMVELIDTWHFQVFDIGRFFQYKKAGKAMNGPYEIKTGDKLTFEIIEVYPGKKFKDTAISEFMAENDEH